jgi:hypothetical protein
MQQFRAAHLLLPRNGQHDGRHGRRRMDHGRQVRVVVVVRSRRGRVDQRIVEREHFAHDRDRGIVAAGENAAERVQEPAFALVADRRGNVLPPRLRKEPGESRSQSSFTPACFTTGAHFATPRA